MSLKDFRKDIIIEVYNEAGQLAIAYKVYRCWVSEYQALPDLDANANAVAIQHIKLENEGWERDVDVVEPSEPTFTEPAELTAAMRTLAAPDVLALWERGARRHALDRSALLVRLGAARPAGRARSLDLPLGSVTASLLRPARGEFRRRASSATSIARLRRSGSSWRWRRPSCCSPPTDGPARSTSAGCACGRPACATSPRWRASADAERAARATARALHAACRLPTRRRLSKDALRDSRGRARSGRPERRPRASTCTAKPAATEAAAQLDAGELLWDEIDARARVLLGEVHLLARAYGWTESEILALGATRRAAYLAMVAA